MKPKLFLALFACLFSFCMLLAVYSKINQLTAGTSVNNRVLATSTPSAKQIDSLLTQTVSNTNIENIVRLMEYNISAVNETYQSPNRQQNLRATYTGTTLSLQPRVKTENNWTAALILKGIFDNDKIIYSPDTMAVGVATENHIRFNHQNKFYVDYDNRPEGVEQTFVVTEKPAASIKNLQVKMTITGNMLAKKINDGEINLVNKSTVNGKLDKIIYNKLKVWDANNTVLNAKMDVVQNEIVISVNAVDAVYPVTIDPSASFADWGVESNQANSNFGCSTFSAGDVNGDGYSDIVVGANLYDNTLTDEGAIFVYLGGPAGIATTAGWSYFGGQAGAQLGSSVCTAGDVNGDGYADIIAGAPKYDEGETDEGKVFAFYGNSGGQYPAQGGTLTSTPQWTAQSNQIGANFGVSLGAIGDFNNDGFGDIIIGANLYDNGQTDEGAAFIYKGQGPKPSVGPGGGLNTVYSHLLEVNQASANFGISVAGAGDINADNNYDVVVGANMYDNTFTDEGAAFAWYGTTTAPSVTPNWTRYADDGNDTNGKAGDNFGCSVSTAGDMNGDGYSDIVIGCDKGDNPNNTALPEGAALVDNGKAFFYAGSATGIAAVTATIREGKVTNGRFGTIVACGGDMNADGYAEVIVGCPYYIEKDDVPAPPNPRPLGRFYIYEGDPVIANVFPYIIYSGNTIGDNVGYSAAPAGDVNGDGFSDVLFSSVTFSNGQTNEGKVWAVYGTPRGLNVGGTRDVQLEKNQVSANLGVSVATAGDVNGDGYNDVIVGAPLFDSTLTNEGAAFIYLGTATGLSTTHAWAAYGRKANAKFGNCVSSAGDVNGDGYSDVIISAPDYDGTAGVKSGKVNIYFGSSSIATTTPVIGAAPGWAKEGLAANEGFGNSVSCAGDVNLDGYSDIIIGASLYTGTITAEAGEGGAFVFYGGLTGPGLTANWRTEGNQVNAHYGKSVASAGDVNGDGFCDVIIGAPDYDQGFTDNGKAYVYYGAFTGLSTSAAWTFTGTKANAYFGCSVACTGDVNADAFSDVIIGSYGYTPAATAMGRVQVFQGSAAGLNASANFTVDGTQTGSQLGFSVSSAGDVNGDGYSDILVGANLMSAGTAGQGRVYGYYGSRTGLSTTGSWTAFGKTPNTPVMNFGTSVAPAGDVNGDGYSDIIIGAPLGQNGQVGEGFGRVFYGNEKQNLRNNVWLLNSSFAKCIDKTNNYDPLFGISYYGRSFIGRCQARAGWEIKKEGIPFTSYAGHPISRYTGTAQRQNSFPVMNVAGYDFRNVATKIYPSKYLRSRIRIMYPAVCAITGQVMGPWRYVAAYHQGPLGTWAVVLPIKLLLFDAEKNSSDIKLNWSVANQKTDSRYELQRSTDGIHFTAISTFTPSASFSSDASFAYTDKNILSNTKTFYYRIKITHTDKEIFSSIRKISNEKGEVGINSYSNNHVEITAAQNYEYAVVSINGQVIIKAAEKKGTRQIALPYLLAKGIYVVWVKTENGLEISKKIIIK
jgi:FG-GAP repeat